MRHPIRYWLSKNACWRSGSGSVRGLSILDVGCGTGRWMSRLAAQGAQVFGIDFVIRCWLQAVAKPGAAGRCTAAGIERIPVENLSFDLALCSFALSYTTDLGTAIAELARAAWTVIITDLHPETGWSRSFRAKGNVWEIRHSTWTETQIDEAARAAGLRLAWRVAAPFGEPERGIFIRAGKEVGFRRSLSLPRRADHIMDPVIQLTGARVAVSEDRAERINLRLRRGRILPFDSGIPATAEFDFSGHLLLPGLINAHDHLEFGLFPTAGPRPLAERPRMG